MRFEADGPALPLDLIEARDRGEVVFLCGAGVSIPAGLPSFQDLARLVLKDLGVPGDAPSQELLSRALKEKNPAFAPPMDQVFALLQRDYGVAQVEAAVARRLKTPRAANLSHHRVMLRLSADPMGRRRLVTTNFDWLFERVDSRLRRFVPPALPDLAGPEEFEGLVFLHGRKVSDPTGRTQQGLVLGSADFGRAYLADGWATRFIRQLLDRYTLVLLGYAADDPPVRYLLEGLHAAGKSGARIYAFGEGAAVEVQARWEDRGVEAIAYPPSPGHAALWRSLEAWAEQASDPPAWHRKVVDMAQAGPRLLMPHQRGQVAALIRTVPGARTFAEATPPPPAEWLCTFDAEVRYQRPRRYVLEDESEAFDPLSAYGLDDDPPRSEDERRQPVERGVNLLEPLEAELRGAPHGRLDGDGPAPLPNRLVQIAWWCGRVMFQPATAWWAARKRGLHAGLRETLEREMARDADPEHAAIARWWRLLLESFAERPDPHGLSWYSLKERIERHGWTQQNLREFARVIMPRLTVEPIYFRPPRPPEFLESPRELGRFDVKWLSVPDDDIDLTNAPPAVIQAWRQALLWGVSLLEDSGTISWRTPAFDPEEDKPGERHVDEAGVFLLKYLRMVSHLGDENPIAARTEVQTWPESEPYFFDKLRVWAWRREDLFSPEEVAAGLLRLGIEAFWPTYEREFLWTLRARWKAFATSDRRSLELRVVEGPPRWPQEADDAYERRRGLDAAVRLGWLLKQGCELSAETLAALPRLRAADPRWTEAWDEAADESFEPRGGSVHTDTDPAELLKIPLSDVAKLAEEVAREDWSAFRRKDPFRGLVANHLARALAVLGYEARHGRYPLQLWRAFLEGREGGPTARVRRVTAARLASMPPEAIAELRFYVPRWVAANISSLAAENPDRALRLWDTTFAALVCAGDAATKSAMGETTIGGVPQRRSRRTLSYAGAGPIGVLTNALLALWEARGPKKGGGAPADIVARLEAAFQAPGEGADHAVAITFNSLVWIDQIAPRFARQRLAPMLDPESPTAEPAWSGVMGRFSLLQPALFRTVKHFFLGAFAKVGSWRWSERPFEQFSEFLVAMLAEPRLDF